MKRLLLILLLSVTWLPFSAQRLKVKDTSIKSGDVLSTLSELTIEFDFSEAAQSLGVDPETLGLSSSTKDLNAFRLVVYKGEVSEEYTYTNNDPNECEEIIGYGYKTISKKNIVAGEHSITIPLVSPVELEPNQTYTVFIPGGKFSAGITGTTYSATALDEPISIIIIGGESQGNTLKVEESTPSSGEYVDNLHQIEIKFNQDISVDPNGVVSISANGGLYAISSTIEANDNTIKIIFEDVKLYNGKDYTVEIPKGIISSKDGSIINDPITFMYKGAGYHYLETGRISPNTSKPISWLSNISVPFTFPEGYNIGNVEGDLVKIYEGGLDVEPIMVSCISDGNRTLIIQPWKFDLKPNTTYHVVLDEAQIFPARTDDYRIKLKDTTNPRVELVYTTPEVLESPVKVSMSNSVPDHLDACERLDEVTLNLEPYEFEDTAYDIWIVSSNPTAVFSDGTTETTVPVTFTNGSTAARVAINRPLDAGREYTLTVPANIFVPSANANLAAVAGNDAMTLTFVGKEKEIPAPEYVSVTIAIDGYASATYRMVKGQESTVDLRADSDWQLATLTLDGTDVTADVTAEGLYALPALEADATLTAAYAYAHDIAYDYTTGVVEPGDCPYALERDGEHLVITGLNAGDSIAIYTLGGIKVTELTDVPADRDRVAIALQPSQYYIILINDIAIRYRH